MLKTSRCRCLEDKARGRDFTHHAFGFCLHRCRSSSQNQTQKECLGVQVVKKKGVRMKVGDFSFGGLLFIVENLVMLDGIFLI